MFIKRFLLLLAYVIDSLYAYLEFSDTYIRLSVKYDLSTNFFGDL